MREEAPARLRLPVYLDTIAPDAFDNCKEITVIAHHLGQIRNWKPVLKAKRCMLIAEYEADSQKDAEHTGTVCLYFTSVEGFDDVFPEDGIIDFDAYDARLHRVHDPECKLYMAISRLLYPYRLSEKARSDYEALLKKRYYPAQTLLVSGVWDRYGLLPERYPDIMNLKKPQGFIARDLLRHASESGQHRWVNALLQMLQDPAAMSDASAISDTTTISDVTKSTEAAATTATFSMADAVIMLNTRCPELGPYLASDYERISDIFYASTNRNVDPVRLLAHILFHELFSVWSMGERVLKDYADSMPYIDTQAPNDCCQHRPPVPLGALFALAADIAAEYQVDEHLGFQPEHAWERQKIYDIIKRDYQDHEIFSAYPGTHFLTVKEAWAYVKAQMNSPSQVKDISSPFRNPDDGSNALTLGVDNAENNDSAVVYPQKIANLISLFTIGDAHPAIQVNKPGSVQARTPFHLPESSWLANTGQGLPNEGGHERKHGLRSHDLSSEKDDVGETASLKRREGHDYKSFLKQFMVSGETRTLDLDSFDPVYYTLGLTRYGDMPFVEPLETKEVLRLDELVIVIDTSGSCSGPMVRFFLEETWSVFRQQENFFDRFHVHILQCDAMVQQDTRLTTLEEAEQYMTNMMIHGGGNTDFRPAFRYIKDLQRKGELRRLKGIIYFTDGFGTFPKTGDAPACKTVFVSLRKEFDQVEVPVWAERLLLDVPEGADWATAYTGGFRSNIYNN